MYRTEMMSRLDSRQHNRPVELSLFTKHTKKHPVEISIKITCANNRTFATWRLRDISDTRKLHFRYRLKGIHGAEAENRRVRRVAGNRNLTSPDKPLLPMRPLQTHLAALRWIGKNSRTHSLGLHPQTEGKASVANAKPNESVLTETDYRVVHLIIHPRQTEAGSCGTA